MEPVKDNSDMNIYGKGFICQDDSPQIQSGCDSNFEEALKNTIGGFSLQIRTKI